MSDNTNELPPGVPPAGNPPAVPPAPVVPVVQVPTAPTVNPVLPVPEVPAVKPEVPEAQSATFETGNAVLDAAIGVMVASTGATQADVDRLVTKALEYGNADLIDEAFARERFKDKADQILALARAAVAEQTASVERSKQAVFAIAGGQDNWNSAVSIFNSSAPTHIKEAAKLLLDSGKVQEGAKLVMDTVVQAGLVPQVNPTVQAGGVVPSNTGALSAADFSKAMTELKQKAGNRSLESGPFAGEYQQLIQRRAAGRRAGI